MARKASTSSAKSLYSVHPSVAMVQDWVAGLQSKTGRSLEEWLKLVKTVGPPTEKERRDWLKKNHKMGTNSAWWIAERAEGKVGEDSDPEAYLKAAVGYIDAMYAGPKAGLRPIHDRLIALAKKIGKDVKVCPCTTIVPIFRNHVFAQIKPSTRTRIDLGFALGKSKSKIPKRMINTGGMDKKDRISHRIPITKIEDIDDEVQQWLTIAYDLDG